MWEDCRRIKKIHEQFDNRRRLKCWEAVISLHLGRVNKKIMVITEQCLIRAFIMK